MDSTKVNPGLAVDRITILMGVKLRFPYTVHSYHIAGFYNRITGFLFRHITGLSIRTETYSCHITGFVCTHIRGFVGHISTHTIDRSYGVHTATHTYRTHTQTLPPYNRIRIQNPVMWFTKILVYDRSVLYPDFGCLKNSPVTPKN